MGTTSDCVRGGGGGLEIFGGNLEIIVQERGLGFNEMLKRRPKGYVILLSFLKENCSNCCAFIYF